jgi:hypothetical protein
MAKARGLWGRPTGEAARSERSGMEVAHGSRRGRLGALLGFAREKKEEGGTRPGGGLKTPARLGAWRSKACGLMEAQRRAVCQAVAGNSGRRRAAGD